MYQDPWRQHGDLKNKKEAKASFLFAAPAWAIRVASLRRRTTLAACA